MAITLHELSTHLDNNQMKKTCQIEIDVRDQTVIKCDECNYSCRLNIQLKKHRQAAHPHVEKICRVCENSFPNNIILEEHISAKHNNADPFLCDMCGLVLANFEGLQ